MISSNDKAINILLNEISKTTKSKILIVEGNSDSRVLKRFIKQNVRILTPRSAYNNKGVVLTTVERVHILKTENPIFRKKKVVGIIDADFQRLERNFNEIERERQNLNLFYTDYHDLDISIFETKEVINEFLSENFENYNNTSKLDSILMNICIIYGYYLYALKEKISLTIYNKYKNMIISFVIDDKANLSINEKKFMEYLEKEEKSDLKELKGFIEKTKVFIKKEKDRKDNTQFDKNLANGHNFAKLLRMFSKQHYEENQLRYVSIFNENWNFEQSIREYYTLEYFQRTKLYEKIRDFLE